MSVNEETIYAKGSYEVTTEGTLYYLKPMKTENAEGIVKEPIANHAPMLKRIVRR